MTNDIGPRYEKLCKTKPELRATCDEDPVKYEHGRFVVDRHTTLPHDAGIALIAMRMIEQLPGGCGVHRHFENPTEFCIVEEYEDSYPIRGPYSPTIIECLLAFWEAQP